MEITDHVILLYMQESAAVHDVERVQRTLHALAAKGYAVCADEERAPFWQRWRDSTTLEGVEGPSPLPAGVSPQALAAVEQFCVEQQPFVMVSGFAVDTALYTKSGKRLLDGFEWSLGLYEPGGLVSLGYLRKYFTLGVDGWQAYAHWLEVVQMLYDIWHPLYGYTIDPRGGERDTPREQVLAHQISFLYDLNVFGPELVEALGRERVASAPAQIVTPLEDGGLLLVPCENLLPDFFGYSYTQVAEHLGLAAPGIPQNVADE